jgi:hypothetical protein
MGGFLLGVAMVSLLTTPGRHREEGPPLSVAAQRVAIIVDRIQGRLIGARLRPGMSAEEADRVVGSLVIDEGQFYATGSWTGNRRYGLRTYSRFDTGADGRLVTTITRVEYLPLFGD